MYTLEVLHEIGRALGLAPREMIHEQRDDILAKIAALRAERDALREALRYIEKGAEEAKETIASQGYVMKAWSDNPWQVFAFRLYELLLSDAAEASAALDANSKEEG